MNSERCNFWVIISDRHFPDGVNDGLELFDFFLSTFFFFFLQALSSLLFIYDITFFLLQFYNWG